MNTNKKEHTETIDLVKNLHKSPLEEVNITYEQTHDAATLSMELKVLLNGKQIGSIKPEKASSYHPFKFESTSAICSTNTDKTVDGIKTHIEKCVRRIVQCFKEW